ncbi:MAG: ribosome rescue GTPase HflX [Gammaproteobacteria bacterium]
MFDRPQGGERAVLVHVFFGSRGPDTELAEFRELVCSAGAEAVDTIVAARRSPDPRHFVGSGKAEEIKTRAHALGAELIVFDHELSPSQERNLEQLCQCRVLDRTGLILDIFAQRARSHEGKLQVELAQLRHLSTRLVRGWSHLERQKGGIGLRGPGEKQLETDRRLLGGRIKQIGRRLEKTRQQRTQSRQGRRKIPLPTVSIVGYTNAGKSTLFNTLSGAQAYTADQLFATLDPTLRRLGLPSGEAVVLADTVGFIRQLPHDLVAAFRATLQETREADLLLHVIDANDERRDQHREQVDRVLAEIGAQNVPQVLVFNKIDELGLEPRVERGHNGSPSRVWLSAMTGAGTDELSALLAEILKPDTVHGWIDLPPQLSRARACLFELGAVLSEHIDDLGVSHLEVSLSRRRFEEISRRENLPARALKVQSAALVPRIQ